MQFRILCAISLAALLTASGSLLAEDSTTELAIPLYGRHGDEVKQLQSASSQTVKFAPGGLIRVSGAFGDLIIEGSNEPDVQIDVKKTLSYGDQDSKRFERVAVAAGKRSDSELALTVTAPSRNRLVHPFRPKGAGVGLETHLRVPRNSRLAIHQDGGIVSISDVTADIDATSTRGDIVLWLPGAGGYAVDAKSKFGTVSSDFAGSPGVLFYRVGERFTSNDSQPSARIRLRVGFGGITIKHLLGSEPAAAVK